MTRVPANRYACFAAVVGSGVGWDLFSKSAAFEELFATRSTRPVGSWLGDWLQFRLCAIINRGALWGIGPGLTWLFAALSVAAAAGVVYWLFVRRAAISLWLTIALSLIMAGTLGNLYDRAGCHGLRTAAGEAEYGVRDFLLFTFGDFAWPVFNFADVFLVTGATMLLIKSFRGAQDNPAEIESAETERASLQSPAV